MVGFAHLPRRIAVRASAALSAKADVSFHSAAMSVVGEAVAVKSAEGGRGRRARAAVVCTAARLEVTADKLLGESGRAWRSRFRGP